MANTYDGLKRAYGLEELSDGSTINGMATIGQLRNNAQQLELHIKQLQDDSLSSAPDLNTQIAVLNKINAANILLVRTTPFGPRESKVVGVDRQRNRVETQRARVSNRVPAAHQGLGERQSQRAFLSMLCASDPRL